LLIGNLNPGCSAQYTGISNYLSLFPGRYVVLAYGMNDANGGADTTGYYNNYKTIIQAILAAGKIPVIPKITWTDNPSYNPNIPLLNAQIDQLYKDFPQV